MINSENYQEQLIEDLKNPQESAAYLWAILQEKNPEADLLKSSLQDILEALGHSKYTPSQVDELQHQLDKLMANQGSEIIYGLVDFLGILGLELTVNVKNSVTATKLSETLFKETVKV